MIAARKTRKVIRPSSVTELREVNGVWVEVDPTAPNRQPPPSGRASSAASSRSAAPSVALVATPIRRERAPAVRASAEQVDAARCFCGAPATHLFVLEVPILGNVEKPLCQTHAGFATMASNIIQQGSGS